MKFLSANKYKVLVSFMILIVIIFVFSKENKQKTDQSNEQQKKPVEVSVATIDELKNISSNLRFSGTIVGDQEIKITSQASGVVKSVNFDLGDKVNAGKILLTIDDQGGSYLSQGENNFTSAQVQRLELAVKQAKKNYSLAKDNYQSNESDATKAAKDIAKLQYESAQVELDNALNSRTVAAPIFGVVIARNVSVGDSIAPGQVLATISKTNRSKVQFYLSADELKKLSLGAQLKIAKGQLETSARVINISPQADGLTKKFLVEASVDEMGKFLLGEVVDVWLKSESKELQNDTIYLPLSAINNTQTGDYIFITEGEFAKQVPVNIVSISGETASVKLQIAQDAQIIVDGNKLIGDGDKIQIK